MGKRGGSMKHESQIAGRVPEAEKAKRQRGNSWILPADDAEVNEVLSHIEAEVVIVDRMAAWEKSHRCTCVELLVEYVRTDATHVYTLWHERGCSVRIGIPGVSYDAN